MPVFTKDQLRVLYVHVPKTGGSAIEAFFEKNGFDISFYSSVRVDPVLPGVACSPQHLHADALRAVFGLGSFRCVFMTVRDPVSRLISEYRMRAALHDGPSDDFDTWLDNVLRYYAGDPFMLDNHIRPQAEFWLPGCAVFRQEDGYGDAWVRQIGARLGCDFADPHVDNAMAFEQVPRPRPSRASLRRIRDFYARDYDLFGYAASEAA